jgi:hypothetical protein
MVIAVRKSRIVAALWMAALLPLAAHAEWSRYPNPRYVPIETPLAQTAVVSTFDDSHPGSLLMVPTSIDGQKFEGYRFSVNASWLLRLLPGKHRIGMAYSDVGLGACGAGTCVDMATRKQEIEVDLQAGKLYVLRMHDFAGDMQLSLEEWVPGTHFGYPASPLLSNEVDLDTLFEEGRDPQEARRRKKAGLPPRSPGQTPVPAQP